MKQALHFGAGNIGRGFVGALLSESGYRVTFVDVVASIVDRLQEKKQYDVRVVGDKEEIYTVSNVDALSGFSEELPSRMAEVGLITCAVGPSVLEKIATTIKDGIDSRRQARVNEPLYIIACENMVRASSRLKEFIEAKINDSKDEALLSFFKEHVHFLDSAVDRIVPQVAPDENLTVTVESFYEWCVEAKEEDKEALGINGVHYVSDLLPYIERKMFTLNTAHNFVAWMGQGYQLDNILNCMRNEEIKAHTIALCKETASVLVRKHGFDVETHNGYISKILHRFENQFINDSIYRIGRSPIRKLSSGERFITPLKMAMEYGTSHHEILLGCACGLMFENPDDPEAVELQAMLKENGPGEVFAEISGVKDSSVLSEVAGHYSKIKERL